MSQRYLVVTEDEIIETPNPITDRGFFCRMFGDVFVSIEKHLIEDAYGPTGFSDSPIARRVESFLNQNPAR